MGPVAEFKSKVTALSVLTSWQLCLTSYGELQFYLWSAGSHSAHSAKPTCVQWLCTGTRNLQLHSVSGGAIELSKLTLIEDHILWIDLRRIKDHKFSVGAHRSLHSTSIIWCGVVKISIEIWRRTNFVFLVFLLINLLYSLSFSVYSYSVWTTPFHFSFLQWPLPGL